MPLRISLHNRKQAQGVVQMCRSPASGSARAPSYHYPIPAKGRVIELTPSELQRPHDQADLWHQEVSVAFPVPRRLIAPTTSPGVANLSSISSAPAWAALSRLVGSRLALNTSTAAPGLAPRRSSAMRSIPLPSGRQRSKTATSKLTVAAWPRASLSDPA